MRIEKFGNQTLYLGDSFEILPELGTFDALVTDPPYGIGYDKNAHKKSGEQYGNSTAKRRTYTLKTWDNEPLSKEKLDYLRSITLYQIVWGGNYFEVPPSSCWLVWDKMNGNTNFADCELAWTNLKSAVRMKKHLWNGYSRKNLEERYNHPTQKPLDLMKWCIEKLPSDIETIIDPFLGSGTTLMACADMQKHGVGIEQDLEYFDLACKRLEVHHKQLNIFDLL